MNKEMTTRYWIIVASRDHVSHGAQQGIAQACHGKASPLKRMKPGDWVIYYSSKERFGEPEKCQRFTAIGQVADDQVYPFDMGGGFVPHRRNIRYYESKDASILPMISELSFIKNKDKWGAPFRFGMLEIPYEDFLMIAKQMLTDASASFLCEQRVSST